MVEKVIFEQGSEEKEGGSFMDIGGQSFQVEEQQVQRLRRKHAMNILGMPRRLAQLEWRDLVDERLFIIFSSFNHWPDPSWPAFGGLFLCNRPLFCPSLLYPVRSNFAGFMLPKAFLNLNA